MILRLGGAENISPTVYKVRADFDHEKKKDRREFIRARLTADADGVPIARKHGGAGAGILSSLVGADGLVALPEDMTTLEPGGMVDFLPFSEALT
jgi:molybdopterin molybdotransferase